MSDRRLRCPRCNGWGYTREYVQHPDPVRGHLFRERIWTNKTCWKCDGKGWINEPGLVQRLFESLFPME
jgi:uncharacterized C2H2 Zn-finger protein